MLSMKRGGMTIQTVAWLAFVILLALIILVFVVGGGKAAMLEVVERMFDFLRFGT